LESIYLSSADWMPRNLDRRVELLFPVEDSKIKERIKDILEITLSDNVKSRIMLANGEYRHIDRRGKKYMNSQSYFSSLALNQSKYYNKEHISNILEVVEN
jgi:polyphosphate kinase